MTQSVFRSFFTRLEADQFQLDGWDNLWTVLRLITVRKCPNRMEFWQAAKCFSPRSESPFAAIRWRMPARDPSPLEAAILSETLEQLMKDLPERDRVILTSHLQGRDIAASAHV